jgi:hypothetical protein
MNQWLSATMHIDQLLLSIQATIEWNLCIIVIVIVIALFNQQYNTWSQIQSISHVNVIKTIVRMDDQWQLWYISIESMCCIVIVIVIE